MFHAWLTKKKGPQRTPEKTSFVVQTMHAENPLPPSLHTLTPNPIRSQNRDIFDAVVQNITPRSKNSAANPQEMLSQKSSTSNMVSQDLLSHKSKTCPSRHTHPERELASVSPERGSQRDSQPPPCFRCCFHTARRKGKTGGSTEETLYLALTFIFITRTHDLKP